MGIGWGTSAAKFTGLFGGPLTGAILGLQNGKYIALTVLSIIIISTSALSLLLKEKKFLKTIQGGLV